MKMIISKKRVIYKILHQSPHTMPQNVQHGVLGDVSHLKFIDSCGLIKNSILSPPFDALFVHENKTQGNGIVGYPAITLKNIIRL